MAWHGIAWHGMVWHNVCTHKHSILMIKELDVNIAWQSERQRSNAPMAHVFGQ